jgi:prevent-host-death family protein
MDVTATEAKNRFGQMLDHAQREPVFIEKSGRRHGVLLSATQYDALLAAAAAAAPRDADAGRLFYEQHRSWIDEMNAEVGQRGLWNDGLRIW